MPHGTSGLFARTTLARVLSGGVLLAALGLSILSAQGNEPPRTSRFVFATGPGNGGTLALARARERPDAGPASALVVHGPLPIYILEFEAFARGNGPDTSRRCGYQYVVESDEPIAGASAPRLITTLEMNLEPFCAARMGRIAAGRWGTLPAGMMARAVADNRLLESGSYEPRLLLVTDLNPSRQRESAVIAALWLKSLYDEGDWVIRAPTMSSRGPYGLTRPERFVSELRPWASDAAMHDYFTDRFIRSDGLGGSRMSFELMRLDPAMSLLTSTAPPGRYVLNSVDLIGIAKHATPVVFVSNVHGRANEGTTRALTAFEERALADLRAGRDVTAHGDGPDRLVLGAVRARPQCLGCHAGYREGGLLGALSYHLTAATAR